LNKATLDADKSFTASAQNVYAVLLLARPSVFLAVRIVELFAIEDDAPRLEILPVFWFLQ
jgi:hypothetical protein